MRWRDSIYWNLEQVTAPAQEPLTLAEAKEHLNIEDSEKDTFVQNLIKSVREQIDGPNGWLGRALITQTLELTLSDWPRRRIYLPNPPVQSVTSVKYLDADGVEQIFAASNYRVVTKPHAGFVEIDPDASWPTLGDFADAIRVRYTAGYGDNPDDVPEPIRHYMKLLLADADINRETIVVGTTAAELPHVRSMLDSFKVRTHPAKGWQG